MNDHIPAQDWGFSGHAKLNWVGSLLCAVVLGLLVATWVQVTFGTIAMAIKIKTDCPPCNCCCEEAETAGSAALFTPPEWKDNG